MFNISLFRRDRPPPEKPRRRLPPLDLHGAFLRRVDLSGTTLAGSNFADTDFGEADLSGSDFKNANLKRTNLRGADLRDAQNLTWEQLSEAMIDDSTRLPDYLENDRPPQTVAEG